MKFRITRTSNSDKEIPPCEEAIREDCLVIDQRWFKTVEEYAERCPDDPWFSRGSNHRVTKHGIARDFPNEQWVIEINSLEELLAFSKKHIDNRLVINTIDWYNYNPSIEIYDDYRE